MNEIDDFLDVKDVPGWERESVWEMVFTGIIVLGLLGLVFLSWKACGV